MEQCDTIGNTKNLVFGGNWHRIRNANLESIWCRHAYISSKSNTVSTQVLNQQKNHMGLSENGVSHIPMDYHHVPPLKLLFVGLPYFQTNPYRPPHHQKCSTSPAPPWSAWCSGTLLRAGRLHRCQGDKPFLGSLKNMGLSSGELTKSYWKWLFIVDLPMKKWWFSIVTLVYQRVPQKWMVYKCLEWKIMAHPAVLLHIEIDDLEVPPI